MIIVLVVLLWWIFATTGKEKQYKKEAKLFIELAEQIEEDMYIEDVIEIMGEGYSKDINGEQIILIWEDNQGRYHYGWKYIRRVVKVILIDDIVEGIVKENFDIKP